MNLPLRILAQIAIYAAYIIGGVSLFAFLAFLFGLPLGLFCLTDNHYLALSLDSALCCVFFIQHSTMVRRSFQNRLSEFIPIEFNGVIYTITSGITLLVMLVLWQSTGVDLYSIHAPIRWVLRLLFVASLLGFIWGVLALKSFDAFGVSSLKSLLYGKPFQEVPFAIRGPYRWTRHPLYFLVLVQLWVVPDVTTDRFLANILFSIWIFVGSVLEERDLITEFGDDYRQYQKAVPMLIPGRGLFQVFKKRV